MDSVDSVANRGDKEDKEKWYPGSYIKKAMRRRTTSPNDSNSLKSGNRADESSKPKSWNELIIEGNDRSISKEENSSIIPNLKDSHPVGTLQVTIHGFRYLTVVSSTATILVDQSKEEFVVSDYRTDDDERQSEHFVQRTYNLQDISHDIVIHIQGATVHEQSEVVGVCVIPVASLFGPTGKPKVLCKQWRQLFPVRPEIFPSDGSNFKFSSGHSYINGFAMTRPKQSLGFICISAATSLSESIFGIYLASSTVSGCAGLHQLDASYEDILNRLEIQDCIGETSAQLSEPSNTGNAQSLAPTVSDVAVAGPPSLPMLAVLNQRRDLQRMKRCLKPHALLRTMQNSAVEVSVALLLLGFVCLSLELWQLPPFLYMLLFGAGLKSAVSRSFEHVIIWNEPAAAGAEDVAMGVRGMSLVLDSSNNKQTAPKIAEVALLFSASHNALWAANARLLHRAVSLIEKLFNLFSFADPTAAIVAYLLLLPAVALSVMVLYIAPRLLPMLVISLLFVVWAAFPLLVDFGAVKMKHRDSFGHEVTAAVLRLYSGVFNLLSRVPDTLELNHRYIAGTAVVNPKGPEMTEAANAFATVR